MAATDRDAGIQALADAPGPAQEAPSARAWYALTVLVVAMLFGYIDRQILVLLAQSIKHDLSLTDLQIGETHGLGPAAFTTLAMYPLAWLADRYERRTVLMFCVLFWSLATAISGLAVNFLSLQACTIGIAVGEAALTPIVYSLIPDLFPEKYRPRANIIAYGSTALGVGLGLALGGAMIGLVENLRSTLPAGLAAFATWRLTFFVVAIPGPLVAFAVFMIGRTKREVTTSQARAPRPPMGPYLREHGLVALGVFGTMAVFSFAVQAIGNWLPVALIRTFQADAGAVGVRFGLFFMVGAAIGLTAASLLTPYWRRIAGTAFVLRAISFVAAAAVVPVALLPFAVHIWQAYALLVCFSAAFVTGAALMPGMMQDIAPPVLRTQVIAAGTVVFMGGSAIGPPLVGFISDRISGNPNGLMWAAAGTAAAGFAACAVLARFVEGPYRRAVAAVAAG